MIHSPHLENGWKDEKPDVEMFAKIAGRSYAECQIDIQRMANNRDPLLLHAAGKWRLISKDFAWSLFEDRVSAAAIERFESLAIQILADDDPRYNLPEKDRLYANIHGHVPAYSATLKQHVAETLAFLGAFGDRLAVSSSIDIEATVRSVVARVLSPTVTWHRWASLGSRLSMLAEASPNSFLRAVREDLQKSEPELKKLLHEEEDTLFGRCNHSGLLWALEGLAWSKEHVAEVVESLLRLVDLDTGEKKWGNRPIGSIGEILSYWMPQTTGLAVSDVADADRRRLSEVLSKQINQHRHFQDTHWAIPEDMLNQLEVVLDKLKPRSSVLRHAWLFAQWPDRFFDRKGTIEESERALEEARTQAISEILSEGGFSGIEQLADAADSAYKVGWSLANVTDDRYFSSVIPSKIEGSPKKREFAAGFIWKRYWPDSWEWVDRALAHCTNDRAAINLLLALRFHPQVWKRAADRGDGVEDLYWNQCKAFNPGLELQSVSQAVDKLLSYERPVDAIDVLSFALHDKLHVDSDLLCRSLEGLLRLPKSVSGRQFQRMDSYHVQEIIAELQARDDVAKDRLIQIEWHFVRLLDEHSRQSPKTLHAYLAESPEFFHEVLSSCFRSRNEPVDASKKSDEHAKYMAEHAFHLLHSWSHIPGTQEGGSIDEQCLQKWCSKARELAAASGRIEVCDVQIGEMLSRCPTEEEDGSWPCRAIRNVIELIHSDSLCSGLSCGIHNSRGVTFRAEGGAQELELSEKYRKLADKVRFESPITARVLQGVSEDYERESRWWDERERWGN